jgi:transposase
MINLSPEVVSELRSLQRNQRNTRTYVKVTVLLMLHNQHSPIVVSETLGISLASIYRYQVQYQNEGLEKFLSDDWVAYSGLLTQEQEKLLEQHLEDVLYIRSWDVVKWIKEKFKIDYSCRGVRFLIRRLGFTYKKTKLVPSKADYAAQVACIKEFEGLFESKDQSVVVYFNDGVHPQLNTKAEYGWIKKGQEYEMPSHPGRVRVNISGALNPLDVTDVITVFEDSVNSQSVIKVWELAEQKHKNAKIIHICDNAKYYKSVLVKDWLAAHPNTSLKFLPPYSPNLNLIERLWRFMRKEALNSFWHDTTQEIKASLVNLFENISDWKEELTSLLTLNFRPLG